MKTHRLSAIALSFILLTATVSTTGCSASNTVKGGAIGAGSGALLGTMIGDASGNTAAGTIIGAAVGGTAGALIGRKMDKQAEELREDLSGADVERVGEGIKITFDSGLMFAVDSYQLNDNAKKNLNELSATLKKYEDTNILIEGHTDNTGSEDYNETLSEKRAGTVEDYLLGRGVSSGRITAVGYGEAQPISTNETVQGRKENRRVEVAIFANEKMKKAAKRGAI